MKRIGTKPTNHADVSHAAVLSDVEAVHRTSVPQATTILRQGITDFERIDAELAEALEDEQSALAERLGKIEAESAPRLRSIQEKGAEEVAAIEAGCKREAADLNVRIREIESKFSFTTGTITEPIKAT